MAPDNRALSCFRDFLAPGPRRDDVRLQLVVVPRISSNQHVEDLASPRGSAAPRLTGDLASDQMANHGFVCENVRFSDWSCI